MKAKLFVLWIVILGIGITTACSSDSNNDTANDDESMSEEGMSSMNSDLPEDLDISTEKETENSLFTVSITSNMDPLDINEIHTWNVHLEDSEGVAVEGADIVVDGGMPQHNHGFPTEPRITEELGGGDYLLEGVKFNMAGWWEMMLEISSEDGSDSIIFNIILK